MGGKNGCHIWFHSCQLKCGCSSVLFVLPETHFVPTCRNRRSSFSLQESTLHSGSLLRHLFPIIISLKGPLRPTRLNPTARPSWLQRQGASFLALFSSALPNYSCPETSHPHSCRSDRRHWRQTRITAPDSGNCLTLCASFPGVIYSSTTGAPRNGSIFQSGA